MEAITQGREMPVVVEIILTMAFAWVVVGAFLVALTGRHDIKTDILLVLFWPFHLAYEMFRK
jgi:hypothetical protein